MGVALYRVYPFIQESGMASVITSPVYDPITTAKNLATKYIAAQQAALTAKKRQPTIPARRSTT
jgi:hypothetical protein